MDRDEWEFKLQYGLDVHRFEMPEEVLQAKIEQWRASNRDVAEQVVAYGKVRYGLEALVKFAQTINWPIPRAKDRDGNEVDVSNHDSGGTPDDGTCEISEEEIEEELEHDEAKVFRGYTLALNAEQLTCLKNQLHDYLEGGLKIWRENLDLKLSRRIFVTKNTPEKDDSATDDSTAKKETYTGEFSKRNKLGVRTDFCWQGETKFRNHFIKHWVYASVDFYRDETGHKPANTNPRLRAEDLPNLQGLLDAIWSSARTLDCDLRDKLELALRTKMNKLIAGEPLWLKSELVQDMFLKQLKIYLPSRIDPGDTRMCLNRGLLEQWYPGLIVPFARRTVLLKKKEIRLLAGDLSNLHGLCSSILSCTRNIDVFLWKKLEGIVRTSLNELIDGEPLWIRPDLVDVDIGFSVKKPFPSPPRKEQKEQNELEKRKEEQRAEMVRRRANRAVLEKYYLGLFNPVANRATSPKRVDLVNIDSKELWNPAWNGERSSATGRSMARQDYIDLLTDDERMEQEEQDRTSTASRFRKEVLKQVLELSDLTQTLDDKAFSKRRLAELLLAYWKCILWNAGSVSRVAPWTSGVDVTEREIENFITCLRTPIELLIHEADLRRLQEAVFPLPVEEEDEEEGDEEVDEDKDVEAAEHIEEFEERTRNMTRTPDQGLHKDAMKFVFYYSFLEEDFLAALEKWIHSAIKNVAELSRWVDHSRQTLQPLHDETVRLVLRSGRLEEQTRTVLRNRLKSYVNAVVLSDLFDESNPKPRLEEVLNVLLRHDTLDFDRTDPQSEEYETLRDKFYQRKKHAQKSLQPIVPWFYPGKSDDSKAGSSKPNETTKRRTSTKKPPVACDGVHLLFEQLADKGLLALKDYGGERAGVLRRHLQTCDQCRSTYGKRPEALIVQALSGISTSS